MHLMEGRRDLAGAAHVVLAGNVMPLDPAPWTFEAMLERWARQQRVRFVKEETIERRIGLVQRLSSWTRPA
jgi:hypothetical protein